MSVLPLVRRWAVDWLTGRHPEVCADILDPNYTLLIGGYTLGPRDVYIPATLQQLARYPGLVVTVHEVLNAGDQVALVFSEHGASSRLAGRAAVWSGVALFAGTADGLLRCSAEEDYWGRRRQLDSGHPDPVAAPAVAPWDTPAGVAEPAAEDVVRRWLDGPAVERAPVVCDDAGGDAGASGALLTVSGCQVHALFSAGDQVAFHATQTGSYRGGLDTPGVAVGAPLSVGVAGLVTVRDGAVVGGRVVRDRLGALRAARPHPAASAAVTP